MLIFTILLATLINSGNSLALTPVIDSITPDSGPNNVSTDVTITGSNFEEGANVSIFGGGPYIKGFVDTPGWSQSIYISGSYVYVADGSSGLQVIDISDLASPVIIGSVETPYYALGVYISGSYAYVADGYSGLQVIDISDPSNPAIIGSVDTPGYAREGYVSGSYAYVAEGGGSRQAYK